MKLYKRYIEAAILCVGMVASSQALTVKLASLAPTGSPWDDGLKQIAADWQRISNGKVTLKIYPGGIAGDEEDMIRKMRIGQLNAAGLTGIGLCRIFPGILAVQLPLTMRTDEELFCVLDKMKPEFDRQLEKQGFKVLVWTKVGWAHFFSKEPVVRPKDLRDQKMFVYAGDPDGNQAWKDAGFHPVPLSPTDLMSSLQSGMVDAFTTTPLSAASYQWFGLAPHMCGMKWAPLIGGIVISMRTWKKVPKDLRPKLLAATEKTEQTLQANIDEADAKAIQIMKKHGLTVHPVPPEAVAKWKAATEKGFTKLIGKSFDKDSYLKVKKHLEACGGGDAQ